MPVVSIGYDFNAVEVFRNLVKLADFCADLAGKC